MAVPQQINIGTTATPPVETVSAGGTGLSTLGPGLYVLRTNAEGNAMEWAAAAASAPYTAPSSGSLGLGTGVLAGTTGADNTAVGNTAMPNMLGGSGNMAFGNGALNTSQYGSKNVAIGVNALYTLGNIDKNTAVGYTCLRANTAADNCGFGYQAGDSNTSGTRNTFIGSQAGFPTSGANTTQSDNTFVGYFAGFAASQTASNATCIGSGARVSASNTVVLGNDSVTTVLAGMNYQANVVSVGLLGYRTKTLTNTSATDFATVALADGTMTSGEVIYNVTASASGQKQCLAGRIRYTAVRDNTTYDADVSEVGSQTTSVTSGTLSGAVSVAASAGLLTLTATFTSSLTSPTVTMHYRFDSPDTIAPTGL